MPSTSTSSPCRGHHHACRAVPELRHHDQYLDAPSPSLPLPSVSHQCPNALLASFLFRLAETGLHAVNFTVAGKHWSRCAFAEDVMPSRCLLPPAESQQAEASQEQ